jgi:hypothetical protein
LLHSQGALLLGVLKVVFGQQALLLFIIARLLGGGALFPLGVARSFRRIALLRRYPLGSHRFVTFAGDTRRLPGHRDRKSQQQREHRRQRRKRRLVPGHQLAELIQRARWARMDRLVGQVSRHILRHRRRAPIPPLRLFLQSLERYRLDIPIYTLCLPAVTVARLAPCAVQRFRSLLANDANGLRQRDVFEIIREPLGQQLIQNYSQRIDVGAHVNLIGVAADLLRTLIRQRAPDLAGLTRARCAGAVFVRANIGVVRNCTITGGQTGIFARESDLKIRNNDISGFSGSPSSRGLLAIGLGSATQIVATHNQIVGQPVAGNLGIAILTASVRIRSNDVRNTFSSAIQVFQTDGVIRLNQLTDNRIGINLIQSPNCLVEDNVAESTAAFTASVNAQNLSVAHVRVADASNNARIRNNALIGGNLGIFILGSAGVAIESNVVRDTVNAGLILGVGVSVINSAGVEAHNNNIEGNSSFGMQVVGASGVVNATNNWWGSSDGPSGVGPGSGDAVTANINFSPFLTEPNPAAGD